MEGESENEVGIFHFLFLNLSAGLHPFFDDFQGGGALEGVGAVVVGL